MKHFALLFCLLVLSKFLKENNPLGSYLSSFVANTSVPIQTKKIDISNAVAPNKSEKSKETHLSNIGSFTLDSLFINGRNIHKKSIMFQNYKSLVIDVCFSYKSSAPEAELKYEYQLKGVENIWHTTNRNVIRLTNPPKGKYELIIKPILAYENSTTPFISVPILIKPIWYKSPNFIIKVSLLILLIFVIVIVLIIIKLRKKVKVKEAQIKEYKMKAKLEMDVIELQQKAAIAQMNPHFVFNSLNTINSIYANGNFEKANTFMSKFSHLLRMILIHSDKSHVPIAEEVKLLFLYFECNNLRTDYHFSYDINVDEKIDSSNTLIPTMLIQPFVENAIIHGIPSLKENGRVTVQFNFIDANTIACVITDNGVGIRRASKTNTSHESKALDITKKRVLSMNQNAGLENTVNIEEMYSAANICTGTKVHFIIPIKNNY
jgi:two-component system, LytTR family, sensor histidine kinase LytS